MIYTDYIDLLKDLIKTESFSRHEENTAEIINNFFKSKGISTCREQNNVWVYNKYYNHQLPTILLNSHHDTVKPNSEWTINPFKPVVKNNKIYGLGSNDAGGALVSLIATFMHFYKKTNLKYNLVFVASAEEEISGRNGIEIALDKIINVDFAIVGEPTQMNLGIAEKGLLVLDCTAKGKSGHAAHDEGENAIYNALRDIDWFRTFKFPKESELFGKVKMNVTLINAGTQHNVVPDSCSYTVDVRVTDAYTNEEILNIIKQNVESDVIPRSLRLKSSVIDKEHPIVIAGIKMGRNLFFSKTSSDVALLPVPSLKLGPGDTSRSHKADEYIKFSEIEEGIAIYIKLINKIIINDNKPSQTN